MAEHLLPQSYSVAVQTTEAAEEMESSEPGTSDVLKPQQEPLNTSEASSSGSTGIYSQTFGSWLSSRVAELFSSGKQRSTSAHDSVGSMGDLTAVTSKQAPPGPEPKMVDTEEGEQRTTIAPQEPLPIEHQDSAMQPLLAESEWQEDHAPEDESADDEAEIQAVQPWMGLSKVVWASVFAWGLGALCTLAVVLTVYNSIDDVLDDDDVDL